MKRFFITAALVLLAASVGYAGNVDTYGIGSKATALGGAFSATADDPYAIYYNPAGLTQIEKRVFSVGINMIDPTIEVSNYRVSNTDDPLIEGSRDFNDDSPNLYAPHLGFAMPLSDKLALGIAGYAPWGLRLEWNPNPAQNPAAYNYFTSYYIREVVTPTMAYRVSDKLSIGFGISIGKSIAGEERKLYVSPDIGTDPVLAPALRQGAYAQAENSIAQVEAANQEAGGLVAPITTASGAYNFLTTYAPDRTEDAAAFKALSDQGLETPEQISAAQAARYAGQPAVDHGAHVEAEVEDEINYSFNFGVMYKPVDAFTLGLTYRSRANADFEGDLKKNGLKVADISLDYDHPDQVQIGVRYVPQSYKDLSFEADLVWTNWNINDVQATSFDPYLDIEVVEGQEPVRKYESVYRRDWEDTKQVRIGVQWKASDILTLRGGYFYDPTPIPDDTLDLMWADADKKTYSLGAGLDLGNWTLDTVFQYVDIEKARYLGGESENLNSSYEGTGVHREVSLEADGHLWGLGLTLSYAF